MYPQALYDLAKSLQETCVAKKLKVTVAESCTGGLIGGLITSIPGSSEIFERGFLTYTNQAKGELLGVPAHIFMVQGAVSEDCATAMAEGAISKTNSQIGVAVTGIAGPGGATDTKPVGMVYAAVSREGFETRCVSHHFEGDRNEVRLQAVECAMKLLNTVANL